MRSNQNDLLFRGRAKQIGTFTSTTELLQKTQLDAAIESALSGAGEKLKTRALDLAVRYSERIGA